MFKGEHRVKIKTVEFIKSAAKLNQTPKEPIPHIAFAGRSNVGKSSLLNAIFGRKKMAMVSSTPGKTRLLNFFLVNEKAYFVDLPGYGYAKVSKQMKDDWGRLIEEYLLNTQNLRCVVVLTDIRHDVQKMDQQLVEWLAQNNIPHIIVGTKSDKMTRNKLNAQITKNSNVLASNKEGGLLSFSSVTKAGKHELLNEIGKFL